MLSPVPEHVDRLKDDARVSLKVCKLELREANKRLVTSRGIYSDIRARYAK